MSPRVVLSVLSLFASASFWPTFSLTLLTATFLITFFPLPGSSNMAKPLWVITYVEFCRWYALKICFVPPNAFCSTHMNLGTFGITTVWKNAGNTPFFIELFLVFIPTSIKSQSGSIRPFLFMAIRLYFLNFGATDYFTKSFLGCHRTWPAELREGGDATPPVTSSGTGSVVPRLTRWSRARAFSRLCNKSFSSIGCETDPASGLTKIGCLSINFQFQSHNKTTISVWKKIELTTHASDALWEI